MGLVQRVIEAAGIATVGLSLSRAISEQVRPPRTLVVRYPFGHALGEPGQAAQHDRVFADALALLEQASEPGAIAEAPYRWRRHAFGPSPFAAGSLLRGEGVDP